MITLYKNVKKTLLGEPKPTRKEVIKIAEALWFLLDDIDTYSDMLKPEQNVFYKKVMRKCEKRHELMRSDGYTLSFRKC